jgi:hypothetical protein
MATQQRIYVVGTPDGKTRLIKAALRQQALSHVANTLLSVRVASQDDLVAEISKGTVVEQYNAPEQRDLIEETQAEAN